MDNDRMIHSLGVANKMLKIGISLNLSREDLDNLFYIGINHDVGYMFSSNKVDHNVIGGNILKRLNFKYWKEIYYYGNPCCKYNSLYLKKLNQADMQVDKYGNDVGYEKRLEDIGSRYGFNSDVYKDCLFLIEKIKK